MAKYIPDGWRCSADGARRYKAMEAEIDLIVSRNVRKYDLGAIGRDDLMQEGRLAATYAVDTYTEGRGKLQAYINRVVFNALAMVATEALALARQPYKAVQEADGSWRRVPIRHVEFEHDTMAGQWDGLRDPDERPDGSSAQRESDVFCRQLLACSQSQRAVERGATLDQKIAQLNLGDDAQAILRIRMVTPPELWILSRNLNRGRMSKLEPQAICLYLGWVTAQGVPDRNRYQRAAHQLRDQFRVVLGVDDLTFEPIQHPPANIDELTRGAKQRDIKRLQPCRS